MENYNRQKTLHGLIWWGAAFLFCCIPELVLAASEAGSVAESVGSFSETRSLMYLFMKVLGALVLVVGLMAFFVYCVKKAGISKGFQGGSMIQVLETKMIAPKKYIAIVDIAGKTVSLGVSDHSVNLLTEIESEELNERVISLKEKKSSSNIMNSFSSLLDNAKKRDKCST